MPVIYVYISMIPCLAHHCCVVQSSWITIIEWRVQKIPPKTQM